MSLVRALGIAGTGGGPLSGRLRAGVSHSSWSCSPWPGRAGLATLLLVVAGCAGGPWGGAEASPEEIASVEGTFRGILNVDGQPFQAEGTVTQDGADLTVVLSLSSGLEARGEGRVEGRAVRMELGYRSECAGTLLLEGALAEEDERLAGRLEARDCTGEARGSFQLDRQRDRSVAGSSRR